MPGARPLGCGRQEPADGPARTLSGAVLVREGEKRTTRQRREPEAPSGTGPIAQVRWVSPRRGCGSGNGPDSDRSYP